jgi:hypothetical protein
VSKNETAELEAQIEQQRDQLAETVGQLAHKLDVKAQARERAAHLREQMTTDGGKPRPVMVATVAGAVVLTGVLVWWLRR